MKISLIRSLKVKGIPRQLNGSDCGVFTCQYAEFLSRWWNKNNLCILYLYLFFWVPLPVLEKQFVYLCILYLYLRLHFTIFSTCKVASHLVRTTSSDLLSRGASLDFSQGDMPRVRRRMAGEILGNAFAQLWPNSEKYLLKRCILWKRLKVSETTAVFVMCLLKFWTCFYLAVSLLDVLDVFPWSLSMWVQATH